MKWQRWAGGGLLLTASGLAAAQWVFLARQAIGRVEQMQQASAQAAGGSGASYDVAAVIVEVPAAKVFDTVKSLLAKNTELRVTKTDDARRSVDHGVDGLVVSNHGGRQLDSTRSSIRVLPEIAAAVAGKTEVLFDSGIRRGSDIVKAIALGADGVLLGRAYAYGLAAAGESGVAAALRLLAAEMDNTMALMGVTSVAELKASGKEIVGWSAGSQLI